MSRKPGPTARPAAPPFLSRWSPVGGKVPDWRNPADYEYTRTLNMHDWAWEFLRRSRSYRADWETLESDRASRSDDENLEASKKIGSKYGVGMAVDPSLPAPEAGVFWMIGLGVRILWKADATGSPWPGYPTAVFLIFSVIGEIEPQLREARRILEIYQHHAVHELGYPLLRASELRPQVDNFPLYVRMLDARLEGVSQRDIGSFLFPASDDPRERARYSILKAEDLANGGYRELLYLANV